MRQARISWFGTNHVKRIYSVTKGFFVHDMIPEG